MLLPHPRPCRKDTLHIGKSLAASGRVEYGSKGVLQPIATGMSVAEKVLRILSDVSGTDEVRANGDLPLYDLALLDSLKTVELMVALSEAFGVEISPAAFEREAWATPGRIIADMERRLKS